MHNILKNSYKQYDNKYIHTVHGVYTK